MTLIFKRILLLGLTSMGLAIATSIALPTPAQARTTDQMTCSQAIATYEKNKRVNVRTRSGQVLPIYGGVPVSKRGQLICRRGKISAGYRVKTTDKKHCSVMYKCS